MELPLTEKGIDVENIQTCRDFLWAYLSQTDDTSGRKISNAPKNSCFAASFMHLTLKRKHKEGYMKEGKSKVGFGLQGS